MKKLGFLLIILILGTTVSMAQQDRGGQQRNFNPEEGAKRQTEALKEALDLKKDQEKKVYELNLKAGKEMAKMRQESQGGGGLSEEMRANFRQIREEQNKEMKKILTDAQWEKYEKYLEERRNQRGQGRR